MVGVLLIAMLLACGPGGDDGPTQRQCASPAGAFFGESTTSDGEDRVWSLRVPSAYDCDDTWPLLIDFHGEYYAPETEDSDPEEEIGGAALDALSEANGVIVVRPRSRFIAADGWRAYLWDANPGDLALNREAIRAIVDDVRARYHLDEDRIYASGYSNGTNMAAQLFAEPDLGIDGYGLVAGGYWVDPTFPDLHEESARVYLSTGDRDPAVIFQAWLEGTFDHLGHDPALRFVREADRARAFPDPMRSEMWAWLDRQERPNLGALQSGWSRDDTFPSDASLLELAPTADGFVAAGTRGTLWRSGEPWTLAATLGDTFPPSWTGICLEEDGRGMAVGQSGVATTTDAGRTWTLAAPVPDYGGHYADDRARLTQVVCDSGRALAGGYWTSASTLDPGQGWSSVVMNHSWNYPAEVTSVSRSAAGTWIAVGSHYIGRSTDGVTFEPNQVWRDVGWHLDVASAAGGRWWIVGEHGRVDVSVDDGLTWTERSIPGADDLFAVTFRDADLGMAVGEHGGAWLTEDGGESWRDVSCGLDASLGDVAFIDASMALVVGEGGLVLRYRR